MQQERLLHVCTATTDSEEFYLWISWCLVVLLEWHVPQLGFLLVFLGNRFWSSMLLVRELFCIRFAGHSGESVKAQVVGCCQDLVHGKTFDLAT